MAGAEPVGDRPAGRAPAFIRMLEEVEQVARQDSTVLLAGEPGSGREAVALALHQSSPRSAGPFVPVDCWGARESWFEMELFGSTGGGGTSDSWTGPGLIEAAKGGTLYLNEIGEIPMSTQARLLRNLEAGTLRRVGASQPIPTDFRLVCSTSSDLQQLIDERRFMPELLLRIGELTIRVPALRERLDDLELLIEDQLQRIEHSRGCRLGNGTLTVLASYRFPGNLRELGTLLQRACVLADDGVILPEHLPARIGHGGEPRREPLQIDRIISLAELEHRYLTWAYERCEDRRSLSRRLGCSERTLQRRLQKMAR
jgi:DNA-binding NtrC family response regulator